MSQIPFSVATDFAADLPELNAVRREIADATDFVQIRFHRELQQIRAVRNDRLEAPKLVRHQGAMVEVMCEGVLSYAGTADVSRAGLRRALEEARTSARALKPYALHQFPRDVRPPTAGTYESPGMATLKDLSLERVDEILGDANRALNRGPDITQRHAMAELVESETWTISNAGEDRRQRFALWVVDASASAERDGEVQTRSLNGAHARCSQGGADVLDRDELVAACEQAGEEARQLLTAENCPEGNFDLILAPDQMLLQIHESIGHPLELDRILGDERNYAGWSFVKLEDFGHLRYGSELLNVSFDPTLRHEYASYGYDDCGATASREMLIENGILQRGLGSLESQQRAGVPGVANFRSSSWNRAPIDRMANLNVEPGTTRLADMIAQVEDGLMMASNRSWSIDDYRDKFQFGCEIGYRIREGRVVGLVKNPNYRGRTLDFWRALAAVGDRQSFAAYGSPFCGKGEPSQVIRVGHASPHCLFRKIACFGRGS